MPHLGPKWSTYLSLCCAKLEYKFEYNFCARLGFNVIWFIECMKIRKLKIEIISILHNSFIDTIHCQFSPLSYTRCTKTICFKLSAYSLA